MPEIEGKLGDSWNVYASRLLKSLGWECIGDKNEDLPSWDGTDYGIDSIFKYTVAGKANKQSAVLESKRYSRNSIHSNTLKDWLENLKKKLDGLRNSAKLLEKYPELNDCLPTNIGVVMVWVHDADEEYLNKTFQKYLESTIITTAAKNDSYSRIIVLDNRRIIRICSMLETLNNKYEEYKFVYPARTVDNDKNVRNKVLMPEAMVSNIIITECYNKNTRESVVFYFGRMTDMSISMLIELLTNLQIINDQMLLKIYYYDDSNDVISVINSFKEKEQYKNILDFKKMSHLSYNSEPQMIVNDD